MGHYHGRSKPYHKQYKKSQTNPEVSLLVAFGRGLYRIISLPFKKRKQAKNLKFYHINRKEIHTQWLKIEELLSLGKPSNLQKALLMADKLLDYSLRSLDFTGETMAERLKSAKNRLPNYQDIWYAHKLRNQIVHEMKEEIQSYEIKKAIKIYEKALKNLRVL